MQSPITYSESSNHFLQRNKKTPMNLNWWRICFLGWELLTRSLSYWSESFAEDSLVESIPKYMPTAFISYILYANLHWRPYAAAFGKMSLLKTQAEWSSILCIFGQKTRMKSKDDFLYIMINYENRKNEMWRF